MLIFFHNFVLCLKPSLLLFIFDLELFSFLLLRLDWVATYTMRWFLFSQIPLEMQNKMLLIEQKHHRKRKAKENLRFVLWGLLLRWAIAIDAYPNTVWVWFLMLVHPAHTDCPAEQCRRFVLHLIPPSRQFCRTKFFYRFCCKTKIPFT